MLECDTGHKALCPVSAFCPPTKVPSSVGEVYRTSGKSILARLKRSRDQKEKTKDAVREARKRLKTNEYSKYRGLAEFKKIEDEMPGVKQSKAIQRSREILHRREQVYNASTPNKAFDPALRLRYTIV